MCVFCSRTLHWFLLSLVIRCGLRGERQSGPFPESFSDPMVLILHLRNTEEGRPADRTLISPCSISRPCGLRLECVTLCSLCRHTVQTGRIANQAASLARTQPRQLWSCREDEWMPSLPSTAETPERGHNLLLSAVMWMLRSQAWECGAARWILPRAYCH